MPLADFAGWPVGDPVYECIRSGLQTQYGIVAIRSGLASDEQVLASLVGPVKDPALHRQRQAEGALWRQTRDATAVAEAHLDWRVAATGVVVEPAVVFSLARSGGRSRGRH